MLVDLGLHINSTVFLLDVTKRAVEQEDLWVLDLSAHPARINILLESHSIDILAFLLVVMMDIYDFDEGVEVNRVCKEAR